MAHGEHGRGQRRTCAGLLRRSYRVQQVQRGEGKRVTRRWAITASTVVLCHSGGHGRHGRELMPMAATHRGQLARFHRALASGGGEWGEREQVEWKV